MSAVVDETEITAAAPQPAPAPDTQAPEAPPDGEPEATSDATPSEPAPAPRVRIKARPFELLPCPLSDAELARKMRTVANTVAEIDDLKGELKLEGERLRGRIKTLEAEVAEIAKDVRSKVEMRQVLVEIRLNDDTGMRETWRLDDGTLVESRPMSDQEAWSGRQPWLPLDGTDGDAERKAPWSRTRRGAFLANVAGESGTVLRELQDRGYLDPPQGAIDAAIAEIESAGPVGRLQALSGGDYGSAAGEEALVAALADQEVREAVVEQIQLGVKTLDVPALDAALVATRAARALLDAVAVVAWKKGEPEPQAIPYAREIRAEAVAELEGVGGDVVRAWHEAGYLDPRAEQVSAAAEEMRASDVDPQEFHDSADSGLDEAEKHLAEFVGANAHLADAAAAKLEAGELVTGVPEIDEYLDQIRRERANLEAAELVGREIASAVDDETPETVEIDVEEALAEADASEAPAREIRVARQLREEAVAAIGTDTEAARAFAAAHDAGLLDPDEAQLRAGRVALPPVSLDAIEDDCSTYEHDLVRSLETSAKGRMALTRGAYPTGVADVDDAVEKVRKARALVVAVAEFAEQPIEANAEGQAEEKPKAARRRKKAE